MERNDAVAGEKTPARPRRRRKEARPAELIVAGLAEFAAKGYAGARLDDVARRAGVSKGTIYRYFEDKEALFLAAMRSRVGSVLSEIDGRIDGFRGTTRDLLTFAIGMAHERIVNSDLRVLLRVMIAEGEHFPALTEFYHRETIAKGRGMLERIIERGVERGEIRPGAASALPIVVMAPAVMAAIWRMLFERHAPIAPEAFLAAHIDLVMDGLLVKDTASGAEQVGSPQRCS